jgi:HlyD family secretion protein
MSARSRRFRFWATLVGVLLALGGSSAGVYRFRQVQAAVTYPVAPARKGDFLVIIRCRGELRARRSVEIYVPLVPQPRIAWLIPAGQPVKAGDTIVKLDSSASEQQLQQKDSALKQAQATLDQYLAQARITAEQDKSDLADSEFALEKARLQVSLSEVKSRIEGEEARVDLGVAEQKLKVQQATVDLHSTSDKSKIASLTRLRDQAQSDVDITKARIAQMELKAPLDGFLVFEPNYSQGWMNAKPFQVGDNVWPGGVLAEMPDLSTLELDAKVEEIDRGRVEVGQSVRVTVDSLPELNLEGKIGNISLLAEQSNEWPPTKSFRAYAGLPHPDARLRPGMNGGMDIITSKIPNAVSIPAKALFTRAGKPVVYIAQGNRYRGVEVQVQARNPDEVAISGVPGGSLVTLVDPEKKDQKK